MISADIETPNTVDLVLHPGRGATRKYSSRQEGGLGEEFLVESVPQKRKKYS